MLAIDIMREARARLGDEKKHRWTDHRLLSIVNDGHKDICKLSGVYRREVYIPLTAKDTRYRLPDNCVSIKRVEYKGENLPIYSRNDLDDKNFKYCSEFIALKDNINMGYIDIYPKSPYNEQRFVSTVEGINTEEAIEVQQRGVVTSTTRPNLYEVTPVLGVITEDEINVAALPGLTRFGEVFDTNLSYIFDNPLATPPGINPPDPLAPIDRGVMSSVEFSAVKAEDAAYGFLVDSLLIKFSGRYGITTDVVHKDSTIRIFYSAVPSSLSSKDSQLVLSHIWEAAMLRYCVGTALQDDNDANNIARGEGELAKYTQEVLKARELASKDFSPVSKDKMLTRYRRI